MKMAVRAQFRLQFRMLVLRKNEKILAAENPFCYNLLHGEERYDRRAAWGSAAEIPQANRPFRASGRVWRVAGLERPRRRCHCAKRAGRENPQRLALCKGIESRLDEAITVHEGYDHRQGERETRTRGRQKYFFLCRRSEDDHPGNLRAR